MRGVQKQNSSTVTTATRGILKDDPQARAEFMKLVRS
jgi:GTP cyclohydrolase I